MQRIKNVELLIPKWVDTNHTSHLSTSNLKNINHLTTSNLNISLANKVSRINDDKIGSHINTSHINGSHINGSHINVSNKNVSNINGPNMNTTGNSIGHGYTLSSNLWNKKTISSQIRKQY
jgi:hypothetical protein